MTRSKLLRWTLLACLGWAVDLNLSAATNVAGPSAEPPPAQAGVQLVSNQTVRGQPPEGRHRGSRFHTPWTRPEWEQKRQELQQLPPEEIRAKIKQWRRERLAHWPEARGLTPEELHQKRAQMKARLDQALAELKQKQEQGTLDPEEQSRLTRLLELEKRFQVDPEGQEQPPTPQREEPDSPE